MNHNSTPVTPPGKLALILLPGDVEEAHRLATEYQRLEGHAARGTPNTLIDRYRKATAAYVADPSEDHFEELVRAAWERETLPMVRKPKIIARDVAKAFLNKHARAWLARVVERALPLAQAELDRIQKREEERAIRLTGKGLSGQPNEYIAAAAGLVGQLERWRVYASDTKAEFQTRPASLLQMVQRLDANFEEPVRPVTPPVDAPTERPPAVIARTPPHPMERQEPPTSAAAIVRAAFGGETPAGAI